LGVLSQNASDVFAEDGRHFSGLEQMFEVINQQTLSEACDISILVKGSRSARMELVVKALEESPLGKLERFRERMAC
jgi:UDP-N-acetylmuramoyl-tripeptide--D-alanyl-D-alanine ligase